MKNGLNPKVTFTEVRAVAFYQIDISRCYLKGNPIITQDFKEEHCLDVSQGKFRVI